MVHAGRALSTPKTAVSSDESFFDRRLLLCLFYFVVCWLLRWCFNRLVVLFMCWFVDNWEWRVHLTHSLIYRAIHTITASFVHAITRSLMTHKLAMLVTHF